MAKHVPKPPAKRRAPLPDVYQFLIVLMETDPLVWRRIQVPEHYSFWDLHVAIQDAMGWQDCHLHEFRFAGEPGSPAVLIGIPDDEFPDQQPCLAGWEVALSHHFKRPAQVANYWYDFGDDWQHAIMFEGIHSAEAACTYPRCVAGAAACPPEDCGGVYGYAEFLAAIADPEHPEHHSMLQWSGGTFDPIHFDRSAVRFDNPKERWRIAFKS